MKHFQSFCGLVRFLPSFCVLSVLWLAGARAWGASTTVVISQVYGGGGNTAAPAAPWRNDFIELHNRGNAPVSIAGWSVQYASAAGTTWAVTPLNGTIPAGGYYLIQEASGGTAGSLLPTADATGTINLAAGAGKVALANSTTALSGACPSGASIVDLVGYGTANCFEGALATGPTGNATSIIRASGGCTDTDNNHDDFSLTTPNPRNSGATPVVCAASTPPTGSGSANPSTVAPGQTTLLTVVVTPGSNPTSTGLSVTGDVSSVSGLVNQPFYDDGTHGDLTSGDKTFSFLATVPIGTSVGSKLLPVTITDAQARSGSTSISMNVAGAPVITGQPASRTNSVGDNAVFTVSASGASVSYLWRLNGANISGASAATYTRPNVGVADLGFYSVVVSNVAGSLTSSPAGLTLVGTNSVKLAQWDFNSVSPDGNLTTGSTLPSTGGGIASLAGGATATFATGTTSDPAAASDNTGWNSSGYPTHGSANKSAGVRFAFSTVGYQNIILAWEQRHSDSASRHCMLQYTLDGATFLDGPIITMNATNNSFVFQVVDLSGVPGVAHNPSFGCRIVTVFEDTAIHNGNNNYTSTTPTVVYSTSGTIRFDQVTVFANPMPVALTCPSDLTVTASGPGGAMVTYVATATGGCVPLPTVICNPPSGSIFPVGTTTVTCTARDGCGGVPVAPSM